jgi:hypothetical protein
MTAKREWGEVLDIIRKVTGVGQPAIFVLVFSVSQYSSIPGFLLYIHIYICIYVVRDVTGFPAGQG